MKIYLLLATIFLCASFTFGQDSKSVKELEQQAKSFKNSRRYITKYDKFEDQTVVKFYGFNLITTGEGFASAMAQSMGGYGARAEIPMLLLGAGFTFKSDTLKQSPDKYFIYFYYSGAQWAFLKNSKLIALADGERIQLGDGVADRNVDVRGVSEIIGFEVAKEDMKKLANAKSLEIKIGSLERKLKDEHTQMLSDILRLGDVADKDKK